MHYYYGMHHGVARVACRAYIAAFPNRQPVPTYRTFITIHRLFSEYGLRRRNMGGQGRAAALQLGNTEEDILDEVFRNPSISLRRLALMFNVSKSTVGVILKANGLRPYHYRRVQNIKEGDNVQRCIFSTWILRQTRSNPAFFNKILWTDEAKFTRNGITNFRNLHAWSDENPHLARPSSFQEQFSVNVWAALIGNLLIGPIFLPRILNGARFLELLQNELPELLDDVPLNIRLNMWLQLDGAPAHFARPVRLFLNENYHRWVGRGGTVAWPPRSPDMTPMDYFLWGTMKQEVYSSPVNTLEELENRIRNCAERLKQNPDMIQRATRQITFRALACLESEGGHFENIIN